MILLRFISSLLCIFSFVVAEERFLLVDGLSEETVFQIGSQFDEQVSPCSTFKIPISLMAYDVGILQDEDTPIWQFQEGYDDFLVTWQGPQSPRSWMKYSCVWFSKIVTCQLGLQEMQDYLAAFAYGNQDISVGLVMPGKEHPAWFPSSPLKISVREQVEFINRMLQYKLDVANHAVDMTKAILFKEELPLGWKLFGKTGWTGRNVLEYAWLVGFIEKDTRFFPFAYFIRENKIALDQIFPRVKQLIAESIEQLNCPARN